MPALVFWTSFIFVFYAYIGYPAVLIVWKRIAGKPVHKSNHEPAVSLIVVAYNEKSNIRRKIENCLSLDYPRDRMEILVSLDGPTDGTEVLMFKLASQGVRLIYSPNHKGKAAAINSAVEKARGEILVFVDARQTLDRSAVRELVSNFTDPEVGAASGELVLVDGQNREASDGVGLYWRYEKFIRASESSVHSVIGVTGAIHAIRKSLFCELSENTILDDVAIPMAVVLAGRRVIFDSSARAFDRVAPDPETEYRRKVRTLAGNFQLLAIMPRLLLPWKNPVFFQFYSHKIARLFAPYGLILMYAANVFLLRNPYGIFLALQTLWYACALLGYFACNESGAGTRRLAIVPGQKAGRT
jgi:biofilm PGA synthesis N-glycosyltransferase PgaC